MCQQVVAQREALILLDQLALHCSQLYAYATIQGIPWLTPAKIAVVNVLSP